MRDKVGRVNTFSQGSGQGYPSSSADGREGNDGGWRERGLHHEQDPGARTPTYEDPKSLGKLPFMFLLEGTMNCVRSSIPERNSKIKYDSLLKL